LSPESPVFSPARHSGVQPDNWIAGIALAN
jgi:hypothetical protein